MDNQMLGSSGYYTHSGKFTLRGVLFGLLAGCVAAAILAVAYGYLVQYNPFVYLNALACFFFAAILGAVTGKYLRSGNVRNNTLAIVVGLIVAAVGLYVSWGVWVFALAHRGDEPANIGLIELLTHPAALLTLIVKINEAGPWTMFHTNVSGMFLWIIWLIEAVTI